MVQITLHRGNKCPIDCPHYDNEGNDHYVEYCDLPDGEFTLKLEDGELIECPLGKWKKE